MAEEIVLGKLIIDTSELAAAMAGSKKAIIDLENEQKKLKKDTEGLSTANEEQLKTFVANEAELKKMRAEYSTNQKSVLDLTRAQTGLDDALKANVKSQNDAIANTKELTAARRQIDATTVDGAKAIAEINKKIDANNEIVRANGSEQEKASTITGNYRQALFGLGGVFASTTQSAIGFVQSGKDVVGGIVSANAAVTNYVAGLATATRTQIGFGRATQVSTAVQEEAAVVTETQAVATDTLIVSEEAATVATGGLSTAMGVLSAAIILTGIGALVIGVVALVAAISKSESASNRFSAALAGFKGIANALFNVLKPLGELLIDGIAKAFDVVGQTAEKSLGLVSKGLKLLGFDDAAKSVDTFTASTKASIKSAQEISKAEAEFTKNQREANKVMLDYQRQAEKLRQIRDDESKSTQERVKANEQLGTTLKQQASAELKIANQALKLANLKIKAEGDSTANLDERAKALNDIADIQERITGQESEQLTNLNSLRRDAAAKEKERRDKALAEYVKNAQNQIDIIKLQTAQSDLSTEKQIENAQKVFNLQNDLAKKSLSGSDEQKKLLENRQELSSTILKIAEDQINKENEAQKKAFSEKAAIDQEALASQIESANTLAKAQTLLLDKSLLTEKDYNAELLKINTAKNEAITLANTAFVEAEKVRLETKLENDRALEEVAHQIRLEDIKANKLTEAEITQANTKEGYDHELILLEQNLAARKLSYEEYTGQKILADKKFANATKANDKIVADQKKALNKQLLNDTVSALTNIFSESKEVAIAAALINTYEGISAGVKLGYPAAIPAVAAAAATGFAAVKNILKTEKGSSSTDTGASKLTTSGSGSFVNTAQTNTVAKVSDAPAAAAPIVTPPVLILENLLEAQNHLHVKLGSG